MREKTHNFSYFTGKWKWLLPLMLIVFMGLSNLSYSQITPVWEKTVATSNLPAFFGSNTERGMAYGNVGGNDRVYVVSTKTTPPSIIILNATTGDSIGTLSTTGIAGGFTLINDVEVSADGHIYACNMTTGASTGAFKVYKWTSEAADPVVVLEFNAPAYRLGDKFTVVGSAANNTLTIYAARASNAANVVIRFTTTDNGATFTPTEIPLTGVSASLSWPKVAPITTGASDFYYNGVSLYPSEFAADGTYRGQMFSSAVTTGSHALKYFTNGGKKYLATWVYATSGANHVRVTDITSGVSLGTLLGSTPVMGTVSAAGYGDMDMKDNGNGTYTIYVLTANNGIGAYTFNPAGFDINITPPFSYDFEGTYPPQNFLRIAGFLTNPTSFIAISTTWGQDDFGNVTSPVNKSARINIYGTSARHWLITPPINLGNTKGNLQLEFDLALTKYAATTNDTLGVDDTLAVVISTDNGLTWSSANILKVWTAATLISNTGQHEVISLSNYSGMVRIGFYGASTVSNKDNDIFVDNIQVREPALNPVITVNPTEKNFGQVQIMTTSEAQTFTISNTGGGTLTITSIAKDGANGVEFLLTDNNVYPVNLAAGQSMTVQVAFTPQTIGAKVANLVITQSLVDGVTNIPLTGEGFDATIAVLPHVEGFENVTFPPVGWLNQQVTGTGLFDRVTAGTNPTTTPKSGVAMAQYKCYNYTNGISAALITPPINFPANKEYQVKFWMYRDAGYNTNADRISVFFNTTPSLAGADSLGNIFRNMTMEPVVTVADWYEYTFDLPATAVGNGRHIILKGYSDYGNNIFIDSLTILEKPSFSVDWANLQWPLTATVTQGDNATIYAQAWINNVTPDTGAAPGLNCWIGVSDQNTDPNTWTTWIPAVFNVQSSNNDEFMANIGANLAPGTYYYASRWQYLGGPFKYGGCSTNNGGFWDGTNNISGVLTVNPFIATLPIEESFEGEIFPPTGWAIEDNNGNPTWIRSTSAPYTGVASAAYFYSSTVAANDWLFTPALNLQAGKNYIISYWYKAHSASYPEKFKVHIGNGQNSGAMTQILAEYPNVVNTTYQSEVLYFTPQTSGSYYLGINVYTPADMWNLYIDDVFISEVPDHDYQLVALNQLNAIPDPFELKYKQDKSLGNEIVFKTDGLTATKSSDVNNSGVVSFEPNSTGIEALTPINIQALVGNFGSLVEPYTFNYSFNGVSGTVINRPGVPFATLDTLNFTPTATNRGTFTTLGYITSTNDSLTDNDTLVNHKTLVYPEPSVRIKYDNGTNFATNFVGFGANNLPMTAAVRFTANSDMKLANIDAFYRHELVNTDSILVRVWAAGVSDSAPGVILYSKMFGGNNYVNPGTDGDYVTLPLGNDAPVFLEGFDFWVSITFSSAIQFPMGVHDGGFTTLGRSYGSSDGQVWFPLILSSVERAWLLRAVGTPYTPPQYNIVWQRSSATGTLPAWFGAHTERGLAYGRTNPNSEANDRLYVVSRNAGTFVRMIDPTNGNDLGILNNTGVAGGTYTLNDIDVTLDGKILAANLVTNASTDTFRVYMWNSESDVPVSVIKWKGTDVVRLGDKITVTGSFADGSAVLYAASSTAGQLKVYKFTMAAGAFNQVPEVIVLSDAPAGTPNSASVGPLPNGDFYWKATGFPVKKYSPTGTLLGTIPTTVIASGANAIRYLGTQAGYDLVVVFQYGAGNENARIVKVPVNDIPAAVVFETTPSLGAVANTNGSGDVSVKFNNDGSADIFVLSTNNGIGSYRTVQPVPVELTSFAAMLQGNDVMLNWSTATESNSKEFQIERNVANTGWKSIGGVEAAGTSTQSVDYKFVDRNPESGIVTYRLKIVDFDGSYSLSKEVKVDVGAPDNFTLSQNYPNPFNPSTRIDFQIPADASISIELYDVTGQKIATLINQDMKAGYHIYDLEASKFGLATGVYIYRMVAINKSTGATFVDSKKLMMLK